MVILSMCIIKDISIVSIDNIKPYFYGKKDVQNKKKKLKQTPQKGFALFRLILFAPGGYDCIVTLTSL